MRSRIIATALLMLASAATGSCNHHRPVERQPAQQHRILPHIREAETVTSDVYALLARTHVPAVSIAFIEHGRVKWARALGQADVSSARLATADTLFQAASLSKPVAAAAALRLVDDQRLPLDEDVNLFLKQWRVPGGPFNPHGRVTLRQLLAHTAGLTVSGYPGYKAGEPVPTTIQSLAGMKPANNPPVRPFAKPGAQQTYSGGGYTVAQLLMTDASGKSFPELMARVILQPAGMERSTFQQPLSRRWLEDAAAGHDQQRKPITGGSNTYPEYAAAGLWTTPSDYGRFIIALQDAWAEAPRALLKPATARTMMTPVFDEYALGIRVLRKGGRRIISHYGNNAGFSCFFAAFLDGSRQGVVVMMNADAGEELEDAVRREIERAYRWPDLTPGPVARAPDG